MADVDPFATATELLAALRSGPGQRDRADRALHPPHRAPRRAPQRGGGARLRARAPAGARRRPGRGARRASGASLGLPITLKESINVIGLAHHLRRARSGRATSRRTTRPVAARTRAAGAVLLGKTNVPPDARRLAVRQSDLRPHQQSLGLEPHAGREQRGQRRRAGGRAHARSRWARTSAAPSACRRRSAACTATGRARRSLPKSGQFPMPPLPNAAVVMGVQGPLARSAEDLELALSVLAGPDVGEDVAWRVEAAAAPGASASPTSAWRCCRRSRGSRWTSRSRRRSRTLAVAARAARARRSRRPSPRASAITASTTALPHAPLRGDERARGRRDAPAAHRDVRKPRTTSSRARICAGSRAPPGDYIAVERPARAVPRGVARVLPRLGRAAGPGHQRARVSAHRARVAAGRQRPDPDLHGRRPPGALPPRARATRRCPRWRASPRTAFPVGRSREGLPIGLQAIGPYLEDLTPIRFAALLAREIGGFRKPAGYDAS